MSVLDASALLAYIFDEPGAEAVAEVIDTASMSSVNFSEVLTRIVRDGRPSLSFAARIKQTNLQIVPFTAEDALFAANLEPATRPFGLSLGDRACLSLGLVREQPVYTADRIWGRLDVGVHINLIR
ncbi:MAG TPA: type II toxin-antitoxin system VapC family toxin [Gammaproteobacteria bacterium]|nr:type II toxin-antitoxin system VapC family toxin [Gammaproteobacteria bacterium]